VSAKGKEGREGGECPRCYISKDASENSTAVLQYKYNNTLAAETLIILTHAPVLRNYNTYENATLGIASLETECSSNTSEHRLHTQTHIDIV